MRPAQAPIGISRALYYALGFPTHFNEISARDFDKISTGFQ